MTLRPPTLKSLRASSAVLVRLPTRKAGHIQNARPLIKQVATLAAITLALAAIYFGALLATGTSFGAVVEKPGAVPLAPNGSVTACQTVAPKTFNRSLKLRARLGGKKPKQFAHKPVCVRPHYRKVRADIKRLNRCNGGTPAKNRCLGRRMAAERGWVGAQWQCLDTLWGGRESGWDHMVVNGHRPWSQRFTYASGIPQFLPMKGRPVPPNWHVPRVQIEWGLNYIAGRYGNPCGALAYHNSRNSY